MSEREASVKLTLDDGQYLVSMRKVGDEGEKAGHKGHKAMTLFGQGVHGATHAVHGLHQSLETATELITGLAAGFSLEEALKTTIELDAKFKHLAWNISNANGELVNAHELQEMVEQSAAKAGRRTVEMADSFEKLVKATGDSKFAEESLTAIGMTATATGESVESLTHLAEQLHEKFEVGGTEMADVLAQVVGAAQKGGPQVDQFSDVVANMGAELDQAGLTGKRGLDFMIGSLAAMKSHFGSLPKAVKGVKALLGGLDDRSKMADIGKHAGIDPAKLLNEKDLLARLRMIMSKGQRGLDALHGAMGRGEEGKALDVLFINPFKQALLTATESGKKGKAALDDALGTLEQNIAKMGESAMTAAAIEAEAQRRMKDPQMQLQHAMEEMEKAFSQPEMIAALNDLSVLLPKAAGSLASFVKFAVAHPLLAGGAVVGAKAGMGFSEVIAGILLKQGAKAAGRGAKGLAGMVADSDTFQAAQSFSRKLETGIEASHVAGGRQVGSLIEGAGALAGIAIAGYMAKAFIDSKADEDARTTGDLAAAGARASGTTGSVEKQQADADALKAAIGRAKESRSGVGGLMEDVFSGWGGMLTGTSGAAVDKDAQIREMEEVLKHKEAIIAVQKEREAHGKGEHGEKGEAANHKANGKAVADALKSGAPVRVHIDNLGSFGAPGGGGPRGSRGPTKPAAPHHGGGY